ncbi:MAG: helix-turn-helix domain-containing protein [Lactobacillaceae bacterium]|nr:helix-turn-helix domain-containing protein [Lactobacillaceae bacterium]
MGIKVTLKALRSTTDMTQEQAGQAIGVSKDIWRKWENKQSYPDAEEINKILDYWQVGFDDIIFV